MMDHPNKNILLALFYHEATEQDKKKMMPHIQQCQSCQDYFHTLEKAEQWLNELPDETPLPETLDVIMENISPLEMRPIQVRSGSSIKPIMQIAFALAFILISIYLVQIKISLLPFWQSLKSWWFVQAFGGFGIITILFFCIGTFITLALTPILLLKTKQFNNAISF